MGTTHPMDTDPDLIRRYTDDGDEAAFAGLVQRHLGLVHATALRLLGGDTHLAQDVAQGTFTELARQAGALRNRDTLAGWLHHTARFLALNAVRAERRRREREQEAHAMNETDTTPDAAWAHFAPVLDDAIAALDEADRDALLLRYFQDKSHREVGEQLGLAEDAARMRVTRALDRLRAHFSKRGVTTTAALLSLTLGVHGSTPAPAALAASVTAKSLAVASAIGAGAAAGGLAAWLRALFATKTRIALVTAGVAGLAAFFLWQQTHKIPLTPGSPYPLPPPSLATAATNQLGLELYRKLAAAKPGENVLLSPFSIQNALAMTYAGADGETRAEMARVLHFPADEASLAASFGELRAALDAAAQDSASRAASEMEFGGTRPDAVEWHLANRLYGQTGYEFREPFLAFTRDRYDAPLELTDFKSDPEQARLKINAWIEDQTRQKIRELIPPDGVSKITRLLLVNALYFKAAWEEKFERGGTQLRPFKSRGTENVNVSTMTLHANGIGYEKRRGYTVLGLPYLGGRLQFLILLPDTSTGLEALAAQITSELLRGCARVGPRYGGVDLYLPKFRLEAPTIKLKPTLMALGLKTAFSDEANFDRMVLPQPEGHLGIRDVYHKTFLSLDECGTEATAATAVDMLMIGSVEEPPPPIVVRVDRPFFFAIQERESGAVLFLGRVTDPR